MRRDTTIPGGRYLVDGRWVDANGKALPAPEIEIEREPDQDPDQGQDPDPDQGQGQEIEIDPALERWPGLIAAGYTSVEAVRSASDEDLLAIDGIGEASLKKLREL